MPVNDVPTDTAASQYERSPNGQPDAPSIVNNTDCHGPTIVKNTNDQAKGLFTFPAVGAIVWVFFREGNPQYPVYFASSYSAKEWNSAYGGNSLNALGTNIGSIENQTSSTTNFIPNEGGGLEFTSIKQHGDSSGASNKTVAMFYGSDGSNMVIARGYHQLYSRHDRRDQTDGDKFSIVGGNVEEWIEGDSNTNCRGNLQVIIGKINNETTQAMNELEIFSQEMNNILMSNS